MKACMGGDEKCIHISSQKLNTREHLRDLGVDGKILLKRILTKECKEMGWIHLALGRVQMWVILNMTGGFWFHKG
jgi:hypothetical protein